MGEGWLILKGSESNKKSAARGVSSLVRRRLQSLIPVRRAG
jgi:hypothetical protein